MEAKKLTKTQQRFIVTMQSQAMTPGINSFEIGEGATSKNFGFQLMFLLC